MKGIDVNKIITYNFNKKIYTKWEKCAVEGCNNYIDGKHGIYCNKHAKQFYTYGKIIDRTIFTPNEIIKYDDYAEIVIYNKNCKEICRAKIDLDDVDKCSKLKWGININNYIINHKNRIFLHTFVVTNQSNTNKLKNNYVIDHINHDILDNRKSNLRMITKSENNFNRTKTAKGYYKIHNKYVAMIKVNGKIINLGRFDNEQDAIKARKAAELKYYPNIIRYEKK